MGAVMYLNCSVASLKLIACLTAEPTTESKNLEVMRKFSEQYAKR
jgi:hypothetical protein